jgi:hypothetical protein
MPMRVASGASERIGTSAIEGSVTSALVASRPREELNQLPDFVRLLLKHCDVEHT